MNNQQLPNIQDLLQAKRILCVQPHYDDVDIAIGGTIAKLTANGVEVIYLTVCDDLAGVLDTELSDPQALAIVQREQLGAGEILGVSRQLRLEQPDAGDYSYHHVRKEIIGAIRALQPEFVLICDPWLPYEAHYDHIRAGMAVSEAALFYNLPRIKTSPEVDEAYKPYTLSGVGFYFTHQPNLLVDIEDFVETKHRALEQYQAQFSAADMAALHQFMHEEEQRLGQSLGVAAAEGLKLVRPEMLHINTQTWKR